LLFSLNGKTSNLTISGGKVAKLLDASGNGHTFTPTSTSALVQTVSDTDFNGQPSVSLDGTNYFIADTAADYKLPFTRAFVLKIALDGQLWFATDGGGVNFNVLRNTTGQYTDLVQQDVSQFVLLESDHFLPTSAATVVWTTDGSKAGTAVYVNGTKVTETDLGSVGTTSGTMTAAPRLFSNNGGNTASGKFAAVLGYDHQLSGGDLATLQTGLRATYKTW